MLNIPCTRGKVITHRRNPQSVDGDDGHKAYAQIADLAESWTRGLRFYIFFPGIRRNQEQFNVLRYGALSRNLSNFFGEPT